jgi:hypothetical protein
MFGIGTKPVHKKWPDKAAGRVQDVLHDPAGKVGVGAGAAAAAIVVASGLISAIRDRQG